MASKAWSEQRKLGKHRWVLGYVLLNFTLISVIQIAMELVLHLISGHRPFLSFSDWLPLSIIWSLFSWGLGNGQWHDNEYKFKTPQPPSA
jgi:hypothetical protein